MNRSRIEQMFLIDIKDHTLNVVRDDGVYRHLVFTNNGSSVYRFELITWPGYLCICGDMGELLFYRLNDMFEFFRMDKNDFMKRKDGWLNINPSYWGEKVEASSGDGITEYSSKKFRECVKSDFDQWEFSDDTLRKETWNEVESDVLSAADDGEIRAYDVACNFRGNNGEEFTDFFEHDLTEYKSRYIWLLFAIVWGIGKYDEYIKTDKAADENG